jgi:exo-1,4-beta-D-glucosaminidase
MKHKSLVAMLCLCLLPATMSGQTSTRQESAKPPAPRPATPTSELKLSEGWAIQSSAQVQEKGEAISSAEFAPKNWYPTSVPATVVAALVENKVYPDPTFGMNLRSIPGTSYPIGVNFSNVAMPEDSPFRRAWWYRKEFQLSNRQGEHVWLHFDGINYRANIWLNRRRIADAKQVAGAYRVYEFNITDAVAPGKTNVLAVEVFPQEVEDLGLTWVDWNPAPPDKNMGLWRDVSISFSGPVALRHPQVITKLDMPSLTAAHLTITAELRNASANPVQATLKGQIERINFTQQVDLAANETKLVTFSPSDFPQLNISNPRVWWPVKLGPQHLYDLNLQIAVSGKVSDKETVRFGIRDVSTELNDHGHRVWKINGKRILIRGGGWAPDLLLRSSPERARAEIQYVKDLNLNAIRFEGKMEPKWFLEMCDREGILLIAGWCCCDHWERWDRWDTEDYSVAAESLKDQAKRLRNHPSIITFWYGSDNPPFPEVEETYLDVLKSCNWPNPYQASASAKTFSWPEQPARQALGLRRPSPIGPTGLKMTGPYEWVPPSYWYLDTRRGGAHGFITETSPGPAVPPIESLRRMLPEDKLWPMNEHWSYHAGGGQFRTLNVFTAAMDARYGRATGVEDYAMKSQVMAYEGQRAMFEAYTRNKYTSTGVIQWMLNNAWPSMIWHLYDYYLRPGGGYFGTKKACELLHIQYSYDDRSVIVVNGHYREFKDLRATAKVYNLDMTEKVSNQVTLTAASDSSQRAFVIPEIEGLSSTYFVKLSLEDSVGRLLSSNFYWLSMRAETLDWDRSTWYFTPAKTYADFTGLQSLAKVDLSVSALGSRQASESVTHVTLENPSRTLAFFVRLKLTKGRGGEEVLPILWEDNYFSLLPGERKTITARYELKHLQGANPFVEVSGWNIAPKTQPER